MENLSDAQTGNTQRPGERIVLALPYGACRLVDVLAGLWRLDRTETWTRFLTKAIALRAQDRS